MGLIILPDRNAPPTMRRRAIEAAQDRDGPLDQIERAERTFRCVCVAHPADVPILFVDLPGAAPICPTCRTRNMELHKQGLLADALGKAAHKSCVAYSTRNRALDSL